MACRPTVMVQSQICGALKRLMLQSRAKYTVFVACQSYQRNFCDGLEIKFTSPLGVIQQDGASETAAKSVSPCFTSG